MKMKRIYKMEVSLLCILIYIFSCSVFAANLSAQGTWLTIDDVTQKPRSLVTIIEKDNQLYGTITKVYYRKGEGPNDICDKCSGSRKNKKFLGMNILWGMTSAGKNSWSSGRILDPENGKIYKCLITISENGQKLNVRGYIGISLLGRTQTWIRQ